MSRYIDADAFVADSKWCGLETAEQVLFALEHQPSIDIVRCKECKWAKALGTYQWCGRLDSTARITADDFCSYGERTISKMEQVEDEPQTERSEE